MPKKERKQNQKIEKKNYQQKNLKTKPKTQKSPPQKPLK